MQTNPVKGGLRLNFTLKIRPDPFEEGGTAVNEWFEGFEKELRYRLNVASQNPVIEIKGLPNQKIAYEIEKAIRHTIQVHEIVIREILGDE